MPRRLLASLLFLVLAAGACRAPRAEGISRAKFVRVNVALRLLPDSASDLAARRAAVLRRERVTPAQVEQWLRTHRASVLGEVWQEIAAKVDSARPAPTLPGAQTGVALPPPPAHGGPQDSLTRPVRPPRLPTRDTAKPDSARLARDTVAGG